MLNSLKSILRKYRKSARSDHPNPLYLIPRPHFPRAEQGLACATILKDEADYLEEWITFHLSVGIEHFYIYDNGSTDGSLELLASNPISAYVTVIPWINFSRALHPQKAANAHAIANYGPRHRWMAFFDVDEFLFSPTDFRLLPGLKKRDHWPCVSTPWHNFGPNGHETKPSGSVIENYTERGVFPPLAEQRSLLRYKTILDPSRVSAAGTHAFHFRDLGPIIKTEHGRELRQSEFEDPSFAVSEEFRLNHYFTRSLEELHNKRMKGRVSSQGKVIESFVDNRMAQYRLSVVEDKLLANMQNEEHPQKRLGNSTEIGN